LALEASGVKVIGVAGPAGSGKSTVARMLARRPGIAYVNCDELAWGTYRPGGPAYARLLARFGEGILSPDARVDRSALGQLVFSDPQAKADLEAIVHPLVLLEVRRLVAEHRHKGTEFLLVEGALLLDSPFVDPEEFDAFVWLSVPEEERRQRLLAAGLPWEAVEGRLRAQASLAPPRAPKVYVVDGRSPPAEVAERLLALLRALKKG
jgi:dephospho-CoA kinase